MVIKLENIWYKYPGSRKWVLENINVVFEKSRVYSIVGPNAIGKTTLLKVAGLIYKPVRGRVYVDGVDYWSSGRKEKLVLRRRVVYVPERPVLLRGSVLYNVAYGLILRGAKREDALEKARRYLHNLGLEYLASKRVDKLSAGEAQLVSLLRALILNTDYILLDEPLAHLDIDKRNILVNLINSIRKAKGVVITTHNIDFAEKISDQILVFNKDLKPLR
ncbi:MAG: energy-coupling factor ABC transporter ATP-binding protein [Thermoprotei archaeon]